jgi:hypothetical protein
LAINRKISRSRPVSSPSSGGDRADVGEELLGGVILQHESAGAGSERLVDVFVEIERGEDEDAGDVIDGEYAPGCLEAIQLGHADVHQHDRGSEPHGLVDGLQPVFRLGHDLDVFFAGEQEPKAGAYHRLVIDDEYPDGHGRPPLTGSRVLRRKPPPVGVAALISPP